MSRPILNTISDSILVLIFYTHPTSGGSAGPDIRQASTSNRFTRRTACPLFGGQVRCAGPGQVASRTRIHIRFDTI